MQLFVSKSNKQRRNSSWVELQDGADSEVDHGCDDVISITKMTSSGSLLRFWFGLVSGCASATEPFKFLFIYFVSDEREKTRRSTVDSHQSDVS